jgi:hypothetical protein
MQNTFLNKQTFYWKNSNSNETLAQTKKILMCSMTGFRNYVTSLFDPVLALAAIKVAVVVGTILFVINHAEALFNHGMTSYRWISALLSYLVPYMVSMHGRFSERNKVK